MYNDVKTKKKSILTRFLTMMMAVLTMAIGLSCVPMTASATKVANIDMIAVAEMPNVLTDTDFITMEVPEVSIANIAVSMPNIYKLEAQSADSTYQTVIEFFITWLRRIGVFVALVGGVMFALAIKDNNAEQKQAGLLTLVAGFVVAAICTGADMFDLFS
ncbi:MAG: hypothetical protein K2K06_11890 [Oscillospiraceae bacterium]|nr:hypothetical protein [Oscillospiraceae bacterium]